MKGRKDRKDRIGEGRRAAKAVAAFMAARLEAGFAISGLRTLS
jgi:hypothetical protein